MAESDGEGVGYGRPPKGRQFGQPGGNPRGRGRAKGDRNVATIFDTALGAKIVIKEGDGKTRRITKKEAMLTRLVNEAVRGELRAISMVLSLATSIEARDEAGKPRTVPLTDADRKAIEVLVARIGGKTED